MGGMRAHVLAHGGFKCGPCDHRFTNERAFIFHQFLPRHKENVKVPDLQQKSVEYRMRCQVGKEFKNQQQLINLRNKFPLKKTACCSDHIIERIVESGPSADAFFHSSFRNVFVVKKHQTTL